MTKTDCRSEDGITVGLIDGIIAAARVLSKRDLSSPAVVEALKDIRADEDVAIITRTAAQAQPLDVIGTDDVRFEALRAVLHVEYGIKQPSVGSLRCILSAIDFAAIVSHAPLDMTFEAIEQAAQEWLRERAPADRGDLSMITAFKDGAKWAKTITK